MLTRMPAFRSWLEDGSSVVTSTSNGLKSSETRCQITWIAWYSASVNVVGSPSESKFGVMIVEWVLFHGVPGGVAVAVEIDDVARR